MSADLKAAAQQALDWLYDNDILHPTKVSEDLRAALARQDEPVEPVAYTTGHCENHKQKGGCQLHNLQCGWPDCDRRPTTAPPQRAEPVEPVAWMFESERNFNLVGYGGWEKRITEYRPNDLQGSVRNVTPLYTAPPQRPAKPVE